MDASLKKILRGISLELRHTLEGWHDKKTGAWNPGDLERRLNEIGAWGDRPSKPLDEMPHLSAEDKVVRRLVDGYLQLRAEAGVERPAAVAEFVRESAYTWANRLFALRCMEARSIIEEVILQKAAYAGRSLVHQRHLRKNPEAATGEDDGLFAVLFAEFAVRSYELPALFDPKSPAVALRPSVAALKRCVALLSGTESVRGQDPATDEVFAAPDAFGWAYQYWNADEKDRVFEMVRTKKGAKIQGADIIPATQLYTEPYMVKFLVQNSLGALWMGMYPDSKLCERWEYYVNDADRVTVTRKPVREITFLDPAEGSGHFQLEAFDHFYAMYAEEAACEGRPLKPREICAAILNHNLYGIDIDGRSVQIATAALWMKAKERASDMEAGDLTSFHEHLVATNIRLPKGKDHLELFLQKHPEDKDLTPALELVFQGLEHADELGALLQIEELVDAVLRRLKEEADKKKGTAVQTGLFEPTLVQGTLPVNLEDYDKWKRDALDRLQAHFETEAQAADPVQAFFGESAGKGLAFFNLLARRYEVVVANPPYMGSKNMGRQLKDYVDLHYGAGKQDLYGAFILRCWQLATLSGRVAMVAQQSWMFIGNFKNLRANPEAPIQSQGVLLSTSLEVVAHLGRYAFSELGNAAVAPLMFVFAVETPAPGRRLWACRLAKPRPSGEQDALLRKAIGEGCEELVFRPVQHRFLAIPGNPICYWLSDHFLGLLASDRSIGYRTECIVACKTSKNARYVRRWHESASRSSRWKPYEKDAVGFRFHSSQMFSLDWSVAAQYFYRDHFSAQLPNPQFLFRRCVVTSKISSPKATARILPHSALADMAVNQIFPDDDALVEALCAVLNSNVAVYCLRLLNPTINSQPADLERLPLLDLLDDDTYRAQLTAINLKGSGCVQRILQTVPERCEFCPPDLAQISNLRTWVRMVLMTRSTNGRELTEIKSGLDDLVGKCLKLSDKDLQAVVDDLRSAEDIVEDDDAVLEDADEDGEDHTCSENEEENIAADVFQVLALRLLGHRWPKQIEADEPLPAWVDHDGVIPLTRGGGETPLIERVRERLAEDFPGGNVAPLERECEEIVGVPLEQWLAGPFFERHITQFKKRPIAWQLETVAVRQAAVLGGKGKKKRAAAGKPVFACLVYYHKLDVDLLPKIRTQYVGLLRDGFETEYRTLERLTNPTSDQQARRLELEQWTDELQKFDRLLEDVSLRGFGPDALRPALRQYGINDALLSLAASWLRRFSETVIKGPLSDWEESATKTELHPDLPKWLQDSMSHLNHFCAVLGPKPPDESSFATDPTSKELAPLVCHEAKSMVEGSLKLGCDRWWRPLDAAVLDPLRQEIKTAKGEIEKIDEELLAEGLPFQRRNELGERKHELKQKVKAIKADHDEKSDRARKVRSQIEKWACPEAETWETWLSAQPLFDAVASLDGQRPPPQSIADFITQESRYAPDINDGVRVNIAPIQKAGLLHADVLDAKDTDKAIADRAEWRADERRWVREGKLPQPGWWKENL